MKNVGIALGGGKAFSLPIFVIGSVLVLAFFGGIYVKEKFSSSGLHYK